MFTHLINISLYPKGIYNMKLGLTVWGKMEACGRWNSRCMGRRSPGHRKWLWLLERKVVVVRSNHLLLVGRHISQGKIPVKQQDLCWFSDVGKANMGCLRLSASRADGLVTEGEERILSSAFLAQCWVRKGWNTWSWEGGCCFKAGNQHHSSLWLCLAPSGCPCC